MEHQKPERLRQAVTLAMVGTAMNGLLVLAPITQAEAAVALTQETICTAAQAAQVAAAMALARTKKATAMMGPSTLAAVADQAAKLAVQPTAGQVARVCSSSATSTQPKEASWLTSQN